jgi:hypothetical protein
VTDPDSGRDAGRTGSALGRRVGPRVNTSPANNASWLVAVGILAIVIPASDKVAANQVFFAAHGVSPVAWAVLLVIGVVLGWLVLTGLLMLLRRWLSPRAFDIVATALMLVVTWFLVGNALAITLLAGAPTLAPLVGLLVAGAITLVARRFAMGTILVVFAGIAAVVPLVGSVLGGGPDTTAQGFTFDEQANRPSILWVISDEMQGPVAMDAQGRVRAELPNLRALQDQATTYTHAYSAANYTDYAVPSQLSGISDVAAQGADRMQQVRASIGIIPGMASKYSVVMQSPIYSFDCDTADCASVGNGADVGVVERYWSFAKDTAAIAGRTALAAPFSSLFPSLDGKWRDFWSGGDEFGDNAEGNSVDKVIAGIDSVQKSAPSTPFFAFWHTIRTHAPWVVDREGKQIYPARVPVVEGAHMVGAEANQTYTTDDLKYLERRLYIDSAIDFDRQLGQLLDSLKASGAYDKMMIVVTADHGAAPTEHADRRVGDTLEQRWSEIAHVPLIVKAPGQSAPELVTAPRSTGQIAATVMRTAGATADDITLSPDLSQDLPSPPVFTTIAGGVMTPWVYSGIPETDPWRPEDLAPPNPQYPFAVGIDPTLLGAPVPDGWVPVTPDVRILPGESSQQLLVVERDPGTCSDQESAGLVSTNGTVIGSVLWEGPSGSTDGRTRGWAIVPKSDPAAYEFWCRPA